MVARWLLCAALLLPLSVEAQAMCRDDLKELKPRIDRIKTISPGRYALAIKWWGSAQEAEPGSEVECLNFATRARRALTEPLLQVADCYGPNAYLPRCQPNGNAVQPATAAGLGGPGGLGGPAGNIGGGFGGIINGTPTGTVGSVGQSNGNQEATGTDR